MLLLQPAINLGLEEEKFWEMTVAEIERYMEGATWRYKMKAQFDYILADLTGISIARVVSKGATMPTIEEVYPTLFEAELKKKREEEIRITNSTNRFMEFALKHNAKINTKKEV